MMKKVVGIILALAGLWFFAWHLAERGSQPHLVWALISGIIIIFGLWLALPGSRKEGSRR
jgi:hypothetical protein